MPILNLNEVPIKAENDTIEYSIVIPTYNHLDDCLKPCIESIKNYTDLEHVELIVVANGCTDGTLDYLANEKSIARSIWTDQQIGFTAATNIGIEQSLGKYIIILNNDTVLLKQPKNLWIEYLKQPFLQDPKVAVTGPLKMYSKETMSEFIVFCCAMIKKEVINKIGSLDEAFSPGYGEDMDFCLRCKSEGFRIVQVPDSNVSEYIDKKGAISTYGFFPIYHEGHSSFGDVTDIIKRNNSILSQKYKNINTVGVVIPAYNSEVTIGRTLDNILSQSYDNIKIIVIDDASLDKTYEIATEYQSKHPDKIILLRNENNTGVSTSRNKGLSELKKLKIKYVAYCDADDDWKPSHLAKSMDKLLEGKADLVYSRPIWAKDGVCVAPNWHIPDEFNYDILKTYNYIWISTVVHRIDDEVMFIEGIESLEDWGMWLSLCKKGYKFLCIGEGNVYYNIKENTMASKSNTIFPEFVSHFPEVPIKLNLGCGDDIMDGWINVDAFAEKAAVKADIKELPFPDDYADVILVSHVVEHFKFHEAFDAIKEWKRVLKPNGKLIIETPDLLETCKEFVNGDEQWRIRLYGHFFAFPEMPGQTHFFLYTETQLRWTLEECGLKDIKRISPDSTYSRTLPTKQHIFLRMECTK